MTWAGGVGRAASPLAPGVQFGASCAAEHRRHFGMETMKPEIVAYQQQIADTFFRLGLIPHGVLVQDAVWNADQK